MIRQVSAVLLVGSLTASTAWAQTPTSDDKDASRTLTGCVTASGAPQAPWMFADGETGIEYRLTGKSVKKYSGKRVEIVGGPRTSKLVIRGGLFPSPNIAAQAGAIDPVRAAIAAQPGGSESGTGRVDLLPEFRVARVRVVEGACE